MIIKTYKMEGDYDNVRYIIRPEGEKTLVVVGCNPSTASDLKGDPTLGNTQRIAEKNGYDSLVMINLYPQRTPSTDKLHNELNEDLHKENLKHVLAVLKDLDKADVMLAYGGLMGKRKYLRQCLNDIVAEIKPYVNKFACFGVNGDGAPKHPCPRTGLPQDVSLKEYKL